MLATEAGFDVVRTGWHMPCETGARGVFDAPVQPGQPSVAAQAIQSHAGAFPGVFGTEVERHHINQ